MARRIVSLDEKIEKAEAVMLAAKAKYDKALDEMEKLVEKRKKQNDKKIICRSESRAHHSGTTADRAQIRFFSSGSL